MKKVSLAKIFWVFSKIGAFTIGGGYAMIPLIQHEISRREWLPDDEIDESVILAQSAPGLLAVNMAIFTGYKLRGIKGSIIATLGAILPSFVIILLIVSIIIVLFYSMQKYAVITDDGLRVELPGLVSSSEEGEMQVTDEAKSFESVSANLILQPADYSDVNGRIMIFNDTTTDLLYKSYLYTL